MTLNHPVSVSRDIGGRTLTFETGRMAKQADGAIFATYGETSVLATAQGAKARADIDFFPMTVEYREKTYAAGKVPGGFFKREMRPRDHEILAARAIDRPVRPMWPKGYKMEVQLVVQVVSFDRENEADVIGASAAMAALSISSLPYQGPGASVRVGYVDGNFAINPTIEQLAESTLDLVVSGTVDAVTMVEATSLELPDELMADAIDFGHGFIKQICEMTQELVDKVGKEKQAYAEPEANPFAEKVEAYRSAMSDAGKTSGKFERKAAMKAVTSDAVDALTAGVSADELASVTRQVKDAMHDLEGNIDRRSIIESQTRSDGRKLDEIREIEIELGVLARTHGSVLFTRGETQALVTATLGTGRDEQIVDGLGDEYSKRLMLHYNFPPFCVGEVRRMSGTSRREVGHGNLAERSINVVIPPPEDFPYSARIVSEILESNGSSSMASVCGGSLALLDAGCPLRASVAGIAMGLIHDAEGGTFHVLSDILGSEDHIGDMDFKVAGTKNGVTAVQMDCKVKGLPMEVMKGALRQAREGRQHILGIMDGAISEARSQVSKYAPRIEMRQIDPEKIGGLIGPGGKIIRGLQADFRVRIEVNDEGMVTIASGPEGDMDSAIKAVEAICGDAEVDAVYNGKVVSMRDFGAFIEIFPGKEGLLHISELGVYVKNLSDVMSVGDQIEVRCTNIDEFGRVRLAIESVPDDHPLKKKLEEGGDQRGPRGDRDSDEPRAPREPQKSASDLEVGEIYEGEVHGVQNYGVFVELFPGLRGLCHISEMREERVNDPGDVVSQGDIVKVKLLAIEDNDRLKLSMKAADPKQGREPGEGGGGGGGGERRGRPHRRRSPAS